MSLTQFISDIDKQFEKIEGYVIEYLSRNLLEKEFSQTDIDSIFKRKITNYKFYAKSNLKSTKETKELLKFINYTDDYQISEGVYEKFKFILLKENNTVVAALSTKNKQFYKLTEEQLEFLSKNDIDGIITDMYI